MRLRVAPAPLPVPLTPFSGKRSQFQNRRLVFVTSFDVFEFRKWGCGPPSPSQALQEVGLLLAVRLAREATFTATATATAGTKRVSE